MVHTRKLGKVMVAVIMALSFVSIGLSSAFAEDGDIAAGSSSLLTGGNGELSAQEDGDYTVDSPDEKENIRRFSEAMRQRVIELERLLDEQTK